MRRTVSALAFVLGLATAASAQDGGKLPWKGKTDDPKAAMAEAKQQSRAMMLFFSSSGSSLCKKLSAGAFSDPVVVKAADSLVCIFVECNSGKANVDLIERYGIGIFPTVIFCDPNGKPLGLLDSANPAEVARQMLDAAARVSKEPAAAAPEKVVKGLSIADATTAARKFRKPILLVFYDDSPASTSIHAALTDDFLKDTMARVVLAIAPYRKGAEDALRFDVTRAPTILLLNPGLAKMEEKPIAKIEGSRSARELKRDLDTAVILEGIDGPALKTSSGNDSSAPADKLSDDEIEAKFIKARIAAALELHKRGKKDKAIETLEDIVKTYPKHVETITARKLLEELRK